MTLRNILRSLVAMLAVAVSVGSCHREKIIPDSTLADIFHDAFVVNGYIGVERTKIDSLEIYEPIFHRYGYSAADVRRTIGNFSRRKSARLGKVVERAIDRLEEEGRLLDRKVVILDTVRSVAMRTFTRVVYADSLIEIKSHADSTRLRLEIAPIEQGDYTITFSYTNGDDIDKFPRRSTVAFERGDKSRRASYTMRMRKQDDYRRVLTPDADCERLIIDLGTYEKVLRKGKAQEQFRRHKPELTIRDLKVTFTPNEDAAIDSLFEKFYPIRLFDGLLVAPTDETEDLVETEISAEPANTESSSDTAETEEKPSADTEHQTSEQTAKSDDE